MAPDRKVGHDPGPGDTVHVVGNGPATLLEVRSEKDKQEYLVQYPDGTQYVTTREEILVHESANQWTTTLSSPRGPRPLLYLGRAFDDPGRTISTPSATFSLVATMVGGGVLSLPYAMSQSGLAFGTLALLLSGCASGWTIELLVECARSTGRDTFELVGHAALGELGRKGTLWMVFIICWLTMIAYFVLIGDLLQPTMELVIPALRDLGSHEGVRRLVLGVAALVLSPMCFKSNLAALRFMCFGSVGSVLLVSGMVMVRAVGTMGEGHDVEVELPDGGHQSVFIPATVAWWPQDWWQALYVFPMFGVSFLCHFNALPTHSELQRPTRSRIRRIVLCTMAFTSLLYLCVGIFGYLYAGRCTCGNILLNFATSDKLVSVGRAALGLVLMLNFPLICQPCRNALFRVLSAASCFQSRPQAEPGPREELRSNLWAMTEEEQSSASCRGGSGVPCSPPQSVPSPPSSFAQVHVYRREDARRSVPAGTTLDAFDVFAPKDETVQQSAAQPSRRQSCALTVALLVSALLVSYFLRSILVVWSILGSTVAFMVSFILPALFWYRIVGCAPTTNKLKRRTALALLGTSVVLAIACTVMTIVHLNTPPCPTTAIAQSSTQLLTMY